MIKFIKSRVKEFENELQQKQTSLIGPQPSIQQLWQSPFPLGARTVWRVHSLPSAGWLEPQMQAEARQGAGTGLCRGSRALNLSLGKEYAHLLARTTPTCCRPSAPGCRLVRQIEDSWPSQSGRILVGALPQPDFECLNLLPRQQLQLIMESYVHEPLCVNSCKS